MAVIYLMKATFNVQSIAFLSVFLHGFSRNTPELQNDGKISWTPKNGLMQ